MGIKYTEEDYKAYFEFCNKLLELKDKNNEIYEKYESQLQIIFQAEKEELNTLKMEEITTRMKLNKIGRVDELIKKVTRSLFMDKIAKYLIPFIIVDFLCIFIGINSLIFKYYSEILLYIVIFFLGYYIVRYPFERDFRKYANMYYKGRKNK